MNNESGKTIMYVAAAAIAAVVGISLAPAGPKATQDGIETLIGKEFYEKFTNPAEATSIEVIGYDPATATAIPFSIEYQNGLWRIPTRYNYPVDAKDRLAKVAASIIGLKRESLAGRSESEQAEFQVLDPKSEKPDNLKGIGNRVTLRNGATVLADYIVGKQVPSRSGYYYVRKPDEKQTFIAKVELNLSTKFTDWIESDVLNVEGSHLTSLDIQKHTLELTRREAKIVGEERNLLTREKSSDPWKLDGLDDAAEEVNQDEVRKLVSALDDLKIVGVRPKPESLRQDLRSNEGIQLDQSVADDLSDRGFFVLPTRTGGVQMVSKEGDLIAGTDQGVEYDMHFGSTFEGSEEEIELGFAKKTEEEKPADADQKVEEPKDAAATDDKSAGTKKSRFIYVTARVNPGLLGPQLEEPLKPEPPSDQPAEEAATPPKADEKTDEKSEDDNAPEEKSTDEKSTENKDRATEEAPQAANPDDAAKEDAAKPEESAEDKPKEETPPEPPKQDPQAAYDEALKKYEADKSKYEADLKTRETKLKEADEKVKALNARFADWYYVISAESFEVLRQGRATLVKPKTDAEKKSDGETETESGSPDNAPKDAEKPKEPSAADEKPETEKPDGAKPEAEKSDE